MRRHIVASLFFKTMTNTFLKIFKPLLLAIFLLSSEIIFSQSYYTSSKKAVKYFQDARQEFLNKNYEESLILVEKALDKDDGFIDAVLLKAEICLELNADSSAIASYEKVLRIDSTFYPRCSMTLSRLYAQSFMFDKSIELLRWYLSLNDQKETVREIAERQLLLTEFQKSLVENTVDYNPKNIGDVINTSADEYVNQYYINGNKLIFTKRYKSDMSDFYEENVFVTTMYDSVWTIPQLFLKDINNIGAANVSSDGKTIYFSGCGWNDGLGSCDIYRVKYENGIWSEPENLKSLNTSDWESQPCVSYDGNELYFVRRNKHLGTSDIYVSNKDVCGNWMKPQRLNFNVNTDGNEMAPFLHHDDKTLYFSSDGHLGMGGYDLFVSRRINGEWTQPVNLGFPLNTKNDEINIVISNDAKKAFISVSNVETVSYDIFEFDLDDRFRAEPVEMEVFSDEEYYASVIDRGETMILKDIYFEFDSSELTADSEDGINSILNFLNKYPDVNIILEGHTDNVGSDEYNMALSLRRAESVKNALVDKGISSERIKAKGCGSTQPLLPNKLDDELNFLNRRVTMTLNSYTSSQ